MAGCRDCFDCEGAHFEQLAIVEMMVGGRNLGCPTNTDAGTGSTPECLGGRNVVRVNVCF